MIEGGHRGLQDYRHIGILLRFLRFFEIQEVVTFYDFCHVSFVFSNYEQK